MPPRSSSIEHKARSSKLLLHCTEYSNSNRAHPLIVIQKGQLCVFRLLLLLRSQLLDDIKVSTTSAETTITEQKWRAKTRDGEKEKKKGKAAVCTASARPFLDLASPSFSLSHGLLSMDAFLALAIKRSSVHSVSVCICTIQSQVG